MTAATAIIATFILLATLAAAIAYEFWKTRDGLLRKLTILLFASKAWFYAGMAFWVHNHSPLWFVAAVVPLLVVKVRWYIYVRGNR